MTLTKCLGLAILIVYEAYSWYSDAYRVPRQPRMNEQTSGKQPPSALAKKSFTNRVTSADLTCAHWHSCVHLTPSLALQYSCFRGQKGHFCSIFLKLFFYNILIFRCFYSIIKLI